MSTRKYFEDLTPGDRWVSQGRTVTETDVVNFSGMTGDYDPLHVDYEFAGRSTFGRPVAHGLLGLAFVAGLSSQCPNVQTRAFLSIDEWQFRRPLYPGDTVHAVTEVAEVEKKGKRSGIVTWRRSLVNQTGDVVQTGIFKTLVATTASRHDRRDRAQAGRQQGQAQTRSAQSQPEP